MPHRLPNDERGFTIVEVMVAATLLVIGLLGVVTMVDAANTTDNTTKAREQGVGLARELLEAARSIPYAQLKATTVVARVQALPGLGNAGSSGWTIVRRGITYTVAIGSCAVDDASDGYGVEDPTQFCATSPSGPAPTSCDALLKPGITGDVNLRGQLNGSLAGQIAIGACGVDTDLDGRIDDLTQTDVTLCTLSSGCLPANTTGDSTPDDYKRIEVSVTWPAGLGTRHVLLASAFTNPGAAAGPRVQSLAVTGTNNTGFSGQSSIQFAASADSSATALQWAVNGASQGSATLSGASWQFPWNIGTSSTTSSTPSAGEVLDGNYTVSATAFDANANPGPPYSTTVTINRRQPYAPTNFAGGHNGSVVDFIWQANKEGDITGYQVYRLVSGAPDVLVCSSSSVRVTTCSDTNPPAGAALIQYYVLALDKDGAGDRSATLSVTTTNLAPNPPTGLQSSTSNGNTVLAWTPPSPADSDGDSIDFYRIYRDGQTISNRYDTAPGRLNSYTDTATGGVQHTYWVTAVDPQLAESTAAGPVTR